ncbi:MAG: GNAT family N-acetyltransferase [candidate division Zixibacteria bacterium]|nr:GNAT family N-acetyltransferase [candidate division Zixibacteria bacterium]
MDIEIRITRDLDSFLRLVDQWNGMVAEKFDGHPFFSHFWFVNYYQSFFPGQSLYILTAHNGGKMVGALPMIICRRRLAGLPLKEVRLLAGEHSHVNQILVKSGDGKIVDLFFDSLLQEGVDLICLADIPAEFPLPFGVCDFCRSHRLLLERKSVKASPFIRVEGSFEEYRKRLSKKFRELLNNRLNRIKRVGSFEIRSFTRPTDYELLLKDMQSISADSWQSQNNTGLYSTDDSSTFYRNLIQHSLENGYGEVSILYITDKPAAFEYHIFHGSTEYCLKVEFAQRFAKLSPGAVLDQKLVKRAFSTDIKVYDLLGFQSEYKARWTKDVRWQHRYYLFNRSLPAWAVYVIEHRLRNRLGKSKLLRRIRRLLKRNND